MSDDVDILLVEDNPTDVEMTCLALGKRTPLPNVHVIEDGAEALAFVRRTEDAGVPRLILLDLKLPKVDGFEVLESIRASRALKLTPVVVFSAAALPRDIERIYRLGANAYVVKPTAFRDYLSAVETVARFWLDLNQMV